MSAKASSGHELWSNHETWIVQLWMMNNEGAQQVAQRAANAAWQQATDDHVFDRNDNAVIELSEWLKDSVESGSPTASGTQNMYGELLKHALNQVDWREIAMHWLDELVHKKRNG